MPQLRLPRRPNGVGPAGRHRAGRGFAAGLLWLLALAVLLPGVDATPASPLPLAAGSLLLSGLDSPPLFAGSSGQLQYRLGDPLGAPLTEVTLRLEFYAFNAYPGNATAALPTVSPEFSGGATGSTTTTLRWPSVGITGLNGSLPISVPAAAPAGTYAVRTELSFQENATTYHLASRGYFSNAQWAQATQGPNGSSTLNLTRLNVSGVLPETAVLVRPAAATALWGVLAISLVLAGAGGYYAFRAAAKSSSGARSPPPPNSAPKAFGKRRTKAGD